MWVRPSITRLLLYRAFLQGHKRWRTTDIPHVTSRLSHRSRMLTTPLSRRPLRTPPFRTNTLKVPTQSSKRSNVSQCMREPSHLFPSKKWLKSTARNKLFPNQVQTQKELGRVRTRKNLQFLRKGNTNLYWRMLTIRKGLKTIRICQIILGRTVFLNSWSTNVNWILTPNTTRYNHLGLPTELQMDLKASREEPMLLISLSFLRIPTQLYKKFK